MLPAEAQAAATADTVAEPESEQVAPVEETLPGNSPPAEVLPAEAPAAVATTYTGNKSTEAILGLANPALDAPVNAAALVLPDAKNESPAVEEQQGTQKDEPMLDEREGENAEGKEERQAATAPKAEARPENVPKEAARTEGNQTSQ